MRRFNVQLVVGGARRGVGREGLAGNGSVDCVRFSHSEGDSKIHGPIHRLSIIHSWKYTRGGNPRRLTVAQKHFKRLRTVEGELRHEQIGQFSTRPRRWALRDDSSHERAAVCAELRLVRTKKVIRRFEPPQAITIYASLRVLRRVAYRQQQTLCCRTLHS